MGLQLTSTQKASLSLAAYDAKGNPAAVEGVGWNVSDPAILTVTPGDDPATATVFAVGPVGVAQVQVKADADIGDGTRELTGTLDVEVVAGEAAVITVTAGAPDEQ